LQQKRSVNQIIQIAILVSNFNDAKIYVAFRLIG